MTSIRPLAKTFDLSLLQDTFKMAQWCLLQIRIA